LGRKLPGNGIRPQPERIDTRTLAVVYNEMEGEVK